MLIKPIAAGGKLLCFCILQCILQHITGSVMMCFMSTSWSYKWQDGGGTFVTDGDGEDKPALGTGYYNWRTQVSTSNSSPNFEVIYDDPNGLLFKNKRDKKILNVDPLSGPGEDSNRTFLQSNLYIHAVIYDHNVRTV
ncbi:hypothetical protein VZT92_018589 [Zoarces viviparus]|uniref:Cilia- and flagella-associated protein 299 n=1 Tax=Zoarces viviparus TaxID=48416 RepID=A0AAW1EIR6_ZOAVI